MVPNAAFLDLATSLLSTWTPVLADAAPAASSGAAQQVLPDFGRAAGRLHLLLVHFPIALGLVAVASEWWRSLSRRQGLSPLTLPLLLIAAVSIIGASASGWINASYEHDGSDSTTLQLHRWIGTGTAVVFAALAWWCWILAAELSRGAAAAMASLSAFRWAALVGGIAVAVTGHLGGDLVHGEGYLTKVLFPPTKETMDPVESSPATTISLTSDEEYFLSDVRPILEARCFECHGGRKQKGGLRLDSKSWLFNGEEADWTVVPGKSAESLLVHRVELDRTDPDAMPPEGDGLTKDEIAKLTKWIDAGAPYPNVQPGAIGAPGVSSAAATAVLSATGTLSIASSTVVNIAPAVRAKAEAASKALIARGVLVQPLAAESPLLDVNGSRAEPPIGDADAGLLADIAPVVATLNLSKTALTDAGLAKIGAMPHLERLRLDGTGVGDAGLSGLGSLARLESINLVGAKVTSGSTAWLRSQPLLKRVYVWQTALDTPEAMKALTDGRTLEVVGADLPLAQPKTPPMPEDATPAEAAATEPKPAG
jgi:uncharacterized membrane protein